MALVWIDLGNSMWVAELIDWKIKTFNLIGITTKNIIKKLMSVLSGDPEIVTALPNIFGKFKYWIIINQSKQYGILEHYFKTHLIKENSANKTIVGGGRVKKKETLKEINGRWIKTDSYDAADAAKFLLYYLQENGIEHKHQTSEPRDAEDGDSK